MSSDRKVYGFEEVAKHNHKADCWLIISGKVYDVTPFLDDHPGGDEILITATGKDATEDFEDIGHSDDARDMLKNYYVGEVDISSVPAKQKPPTTRSSQVNAQASQSSGSVLKIVQFLLPLLMIGVAFVLVKFMKKE